MGNNCCGDRFTSHKEAIKLIRDSTFKEGKDDTEAVEKLWNFYCKKDKEKKTVTKEELKSLSADFNKAIVELCKKYLGDDEGLAADETTDLKKKAVKASKESAQQALENNDGDITTSHFLASIFGFKQEGDGEEKKTVPVMKISKDDFVKKLTAMFQTGLPKANGKEDYKMSKGPKAEPTKAS